MRIGIDARWIFKEFSGIGLYTQELIRGLVRLASGHELILFFNDPALRDRTWRQAEISDRSHVRAEMIPWGVFSMPSQLFLPGRIRKLGLDIFHSPNYMLPFAAFSRRRPHRTRGVITIHDLIPLLFPQFTPKALKTRFYPVYRRVMKEAGTRADMMLTVSETSRRDIIQHLNVPDSRVVAIPNGVAQEYQPATPAKSGPKTILYVGRFDPYKNVLGLLEAFRLVRERARQEVRLRLVGAPDPRYPEAPRRARELGVAEAVEWTGSAAGPELVSAYQSADVFVLLSYYEGFGLTLLEAMACGTPVVCSRIGAIQEVAGDAALLVPPDRPAEAASAILKLLTEPDHAADLRRKGLARAAEFSWWKTAERTLKAYEQTLNT